MPLEHLSQPRPSSSLKVEVPPLFWLSSLHVRVVYGLSCILSFRLRPPVSVKVTQVKETKDTIKGKHKTKRNDTLKTNKSASVTSSGKRVPCSKYFSISPSTVRTVYPKPFLTSHMVFISLVLVSIFLSMQAFFFNGLVIVIVARGGEPILCYDCQCNVKM